MVEGLTPDEVMFEKGKSGGRVNSDPVTKGEEHMAEVTTAMLYLACGGMDEAHNLVLPYSWPEDTKFGGQAIKGSPAAKESEYCHALIHRYSLLPNVKHVCFAWRVWFFHYRMLDINCLYA